MKTVVTFLIVALCVAAPLIAQRGFKLSGKHLKSVLGINIFSFFGMLTALTVLMWTGHTDVFAAGEAAAEGLSSGMQYLAAALSTGLGCIGGGIAVAAAASAALGAISEDPTIMGKSLIFVALAEGIALYGLLIAFMILP